MKRSILGFGIILGRIVAVSAAAPTPLTTLRAIHALSNAEADKGLPVAFEATVTFVNLPLCARRRRGHIDAHSLSVEKLLSDQGIPQETEIYVR